MHTVFVRLPNERSYKCFDCENEGIKGSDLKVFLATVVKNFDFMLYCNGKEVLNEQHVQPNSTVYVSFSLPGGKGGFGSMLRAIGAQIEKTTNREACRDLSGRRLRDINEEQRLKKWIAKKAEREAEKIRRRKERIERLKSRPKHNFVDFGYEKEISELPDRIDDALTAGMQKVSKRPLELNEPSSSTGKKKRLWLEEDISASSDSDKDLEDNLSECLSSGSSEEKTNAESTNACQSVSFEASETSSSGDSNSGFKSCTETSTDNLHKAPIEDETLKPDSESSVEVSETDTVPSENQEITTAAEIAPGNQEMTTTAEITPENVAQSEDCLKYESSVQEHPQICKEEDQNNPIDLQEFHDVSELEALGLERLKVALMDRGLKCGGSVVDRAQRLWAVRGLEPDRYPKNLLAKQKK